MSEDPTPADPEPAPAPEPAALYGLGLPLPLATTVGPHVTGVALGLVGLALLGSGCTWSRALAAGAAIGAAGLSDLSLITSLSAPVIAWALLTRGGAQRWGVAAGASLAAAAFLARNALYFGHPLHALPPPELMHPDLAADAALGAYGLDQPAGLDLGLLPEQLVGERAGLFLFAPALLVGLLGLPRAGASSARPVRPGRGGRPAGPAPERAQAGRLVAPRPRGRAICCPRRPRWRSRWRWRSSADRAWGWRSARWGAFVSWVQAQTPFYATFRSALLDLLQFGPRLRLVHTHDQLRPGQDASWLAFLLSPLLAAPVLLVVGRLLLPPARRRPVLIGVALVWSAAALATTPPGPAPRSAWPSSAAASPASPTRTA